MLDHCTDLAEPLATQQKYCADGPNDIGRRPSVGHHVDGATVRYTGARAGDDNVRNNQMSRAVN